MVIGERVTGLAGMRRPVGLGVLGLHWGGFLCLIFCDLYHFFLAMQGGAGARR